MKVLWIVNTIFPYPSKQLGKDATCFGGWLISLHEELIKNKDIKIAIATTYNGSTLKRFEDGQTTYFLIPDSNPEAYNKKLEKYWQEITSDVKPDIVHIHGTEYPRGLAFLNCNLNIPTVASIQGLIYRCQKVYYANLPYSVLLKNITIRDLLKPRTGLLSHKSAEKRGVYEKEILRKVDGIVGRTTWDYASAKAINPNCNYFHGDESLRNLFYKEKWDVNKTNKQTIFFSQAQAPLKGFYLLLEALGVLKQKYPNIIVRVAGKNLLDESSFKARLKQQSYTKYLKKLIKKYDLEKNIQFTGYLDEKGIVNELKNCNVFVQSASIENSSNSLCEAMILGVPCVASNVGGTDDMLEHKKEGFLYPYTETDMLANYIHSFFEDEDLCQKMGNNARKRALFRHDRSNNVKELLKAYRDMIKRTGENNEKNRISN